MRDLETNKNWALERLVPDLIPWYSRKTLADHVSRYQFAAAYVKDKKVLDIACGSGYGSKYLAEAGAQKVVGVDISKPAIAYAQKRYSHAQVSFQVGNAARIPQPNQSVDVVVSFETLEHVREHMQFLKEIKRVLKKDGLCIISTPNQLLNDETCNEFHVHQFTQEDFVKDLELHFRHVTLFGQKPMYARYLSFVRSVTSRLPEGFIKWFVDSGLKSMFRGVAITPIVEIKHGFVPAFFVAVCTIN